MSTREKDKTEIERLLEDLRWHPGREALFLRRLTKIVAEQQKQLEDHEQRIKYLEGKHRMIR